MEKLLNSVRPVIRYGPDLMAIKNAGSESRAVFLPFSHSPNLLVWSLIEEAAAGNRDNSENV